MKKSLFLLVVFACLFITGCGSEGGGGILPTGKIVTCSKTYTEDDITTTEVMTATFKGEKLSYFNGHSTMTFADEATAKTTYSYMGMATSILESYGFTVSAKQNDKDIVMDYEGDMKTITKKLKDVPEADFDYTEDTTNTTFEEEMAKDGYTCK